MRDDRSDADRSDADDLSVPSVRVPEGWVEIESSTERVFALSKVTVVAATVVYEDETLREAVRERLDGDAFRRFFFASRLRLRPKTKPSKALTKLVTSRAKNGFASRLEERGIVDVSERESRRFRVDGTEATLVGYGAARRLGEASLAVDGWVAVWPDEDVTGDFFVAGGAYPTRVESGPDALSELLEPGRFRDDLLELIRTVE